MNHCHWYLFIVICRLIWSVTWRSWTCVYRWFNSLFDCWSSSYCIYPILVRLLSTGVEGHGWLITASSTTSSSKWWSKSWWWLFVNCCWITWPIIQISITWWRLFVSRSNIAPTNSLIYFHDVLFQLNPLWPCTLISAKHKLNHWFQFFRIALTKTTYVIV